MLHLTLKYIYNVTPHKVIKLDKIYKIRTAFGGACLCCFTHARIPNLSFLLRTDTRQKPSLVLVVCTLCKHTLSPKNL